MSELFASVDADLPAMQALPSVSSERLAEAFASWAHARGRLGHLRAQMAAAGAQPAASPETAAVLDAVRTQEARCTQLWRELASVDAELAAAREASWAADFQAHVQRINDGRAIDRVTPLEDAPVNILIVDDESSNLTALEAVLDDPGYRLVRAASGEQALLALITGEFACVLLDVQMPGMTGLELARMINERGDGARPPIIFLTAHDKEDRHALEGYASGGVDYLHKPFHPAVLRQKVEVFADLHRMKRQLQLRAAAREQLARIEMAGTAAAEAGRRADFLTEANRVLSRPLDFDDVIAAVLELCAPMLGTGAILALGDEEGAQRRFEMHPTPPGDGADALLAELHVDFGQAIRQRDVRLWRSGERACVICPLMTGDKALGALGVLGPVASFDAGRIDLVRDFSIRAASALENARLNTAVQEAERRKDKFLAMLAHELRNPLAPISNAVQIIQGRTAPPSTMHWACEVIGRQAGQMSRLVDDLLDAARLGQGKVAVTRETLTLATIVEGAVEASTPRLQQRRQAIAVDLPRHAIEIEGDLVRLVQAMSNLIDNASKFSAPGTTIHVTAACADGEARICVKDAGAGIAPELLPHVFDLFAQAEQPIDRPHGGLGVGLTLVRHIVQLHGGRVTALSDGLGKGTEVVVQLPAKPAAGGQPHIAHRD